MKIGGKERGDLWESLTREVNKSQPLNQIRSIAIRPYDKENAPACNSSPDVMERQLSVINSDGNMKSTGKRRGD